MTLSGNFEGLLSVTELEQSSKETLNYITHLTRIYVPNSQRFRKSVLKQFGTLPKKTVFTKLSKDGTYFPFQYNSCIYMESAIVQLRFHQIWPHWDVWFRRYSTKKVKLSKITKVLLFKLVALYALEKLRAEMFVLHNTPTFYAYIELASYSFVGYNIKTP